MQRIVIKVGSRVLTEAEGVAKIRLLELVKLLTALLRAGYEVILVSSGAIAAGYSQIKLDREDMINRQALSAIGQPYLLKLYQDLFDNFGILCSQVLLSSDIFESTKRTAHAKNAINRLLESGVIPIINENDTVSIEELVLGDNDLLSAHVTHYFDADILVILSDIDAYCDPYQSDRVLSLVSTPISEVHLSKKNTTSSYASSDITTKLQSANFLMQYNKPMFLASGFDLSDVRSFLLDKVQKGGTLFECSL